MPIGPARMPILDHLSELRMRLVRIVVVLIIAICVFYLAAGTMGQFLLLPISEFLPRTETGAVSLNFLNAFDPFTVKFKIAFWTSIMATSPIILWQILAFFLPALRENEKKWFIPTFAAGVFLFIAGTVFCYLIILNPAFEWLTSQTNGLGVVEPNAVSYIDVIIKFEIAFGFAFELPIIVFYLVLFGIVPYDKLRKSWRIVYVALLIFSGMVTPDANPVTMFIMFAALLLMYELSMLIARFALAKRIKRQQEEACEFEDGDDDSDDDDDDDDEDCDDVEDDKN